MTVPPQLYELIERFRDNLPAYKQGRYNETQVRIEFIDPLFKLLGWDIDNRLGYAEAYKEVVHEDAIKIGRATKAPDYSFRTGGVRKFFLEAKKPSVDIKHDTHPAYQLRRYAWSAKLPLSILTDFEEFAVYDSRVRPVKTDQAATARILYLTYNQYPEQWEMLANTFSPEAIRKGAFDRYAETTKVKKGTAEVDSAFLQEIERWRDSLARNLALRNNLNQRQLNYGVQILIDRLIFLRIAEDRGLEPYGQLRDQLKGAGVYGRLIQLFERADDRYNSGLFHFKSEKGRPEAPDTLTPKLSLDDKLWQDILKNLYYPDSPYEFSVLPADILGQVYEQFLGKVIRLTGGGRRAVVEDKPEVKKAGGVYYTPTYIVDYIVRQTVGKLVEGKTPTQVGGRAPLKIADPACGSGSFLLGAYQFLLDWYRDRYLEDSPEKWARGRDPRLYQAGSGDWKLTTEERKRILLEHIYGVDIDPQAVEVTKLSLLLKVLEGEDEQSLARQLTLAGFGERVLPDLSHNIKCGNSLIGPDFYAGQPTQMSLFDEEEMYRINAFDWQAEFPEIMQAGGFDTVIGNPPYVRQEMLGEFKAYFQQKYKVYHGSADLYAYFIERGRSLIKPNGRFGYIVANKWMRANYGAPLRQWLKQQCIEEIIDFGDLPVFEKATTYPCILCLRAAPPEANFRVVQVKTLDFTLLDDYVRKHQYFLKSDELDDKAWSLAAEQTQQLLTKLNSQGIPLKKYTKANLYRGIVTGFNKAFVINAEVRARLIAEDPKSAELIKPFLTGRDVKRYYSPKSSQYLIFTRRGINIKDYPAIARYLSQFKEQLTPQPKDWKGGTWGGRKPGPYQWYEIQDSIEYYADFDKPKIIFPSIVQKASYTFDPNGFYSNDKTSIIVTDDLYLLGILNSKVSDFVMHLISSTKRGGYFEYKPMYVQQLPIRPIDFNNPTDRVQHDRIVSLVEQILELQRRLAQDNPPQMQAMLKRQIEMTDKQIDGLVYELYGLGEEEIRLVEGTGGTTTNLERTHASERTNWGIEEDG